MSVTTMWPDVRAVSSISDRAPLLRWMIFTGLCVFAGVLLWHYGLIRLMLASDRTYISAIIGLLYIGASLHCLWRTLAIAREGDAGRDAALILAKPDAVLSVAATSSERGALTRFTDRKFRPITKLRSWRSRAGMSGKSACGEGPIAGGMGELDRNRLRM